MNFDEWEKENWMYIDVKENARVIWEASQSAEREACAEICDELKSIDYCVDVRQAADAIRKRSNVELSRADK